MIEEEGLKDTFPYLDNIKVAGKDQATFRDSFKIFDLGICPSTKAINILGYCIGNGIIEHDTERLRPFQEFSPPTNRHSLHRVVGMLT